MNFSLNPYEPDVITPLLNIRKPLPERPAATYASSSFNLNTYEDISIADIENMLGYLDPDMSYDEWIEIGMAVHSYGLPRTIWEGWSAKGAKYQAGECERHWRSFKSGGGVGIGTLVFKAKERGYHPPDHVAQATKFKQASLNEKAIIPLYHWSELKTLPKRKYLIKSLLDKRAMSVIYGASNSGKTFLALDIAIHIAMGEDWRGQRTRQGKVVYIAGEGGIGLYERLSAFKLHHELDYEPDVYIIPTTVSLCGDDAQTQDLLERVSSLSDIALIVVDTLARAIAGGDENSTKDMSAFVKHCDTLREQTRAHVMIVHHSGKDESKGARGSSALKAAIDTEIQVTQSSCGTITATVQKQREGKTGRSYDFTLTEHHVWTDEDGEPVTSAALEPAERLEKAESLSGQAQRAYQVLLNLMLDKGIEHQPKPKMKTQTVVRLRDFKDHFSKAGITDTDKPDSVNKAFHRCKNKLKSLGYIGEWDGYIWILDKTDIDGQTGFYELVT